MTPSIPVWLQIVLGICATLLSGGGAYIAYQSWSTARNKLKLDLFERRLAIYEGAHSFVGSIVTSGKVRQEALSEYLVATRTVRWVLNDSIGKHLSDNLYSPALELQGLDAELDGMPNGEERTSNVKRQRELKDTLNAQFEHLDAAFAPFLQLKD